MAFQRLIHKLTETSMIAAALRAGGAATHGAMALKFYDRQLTSRRCILNAPKKAGVAQGLLGKHPLRA